MKTLNIKLSDEIIAFADSQAAKAGHRNAQAYIRALIEADQERHSKLGREMAKLRADVALGIEQLERGEFTEYTDETLHQLLNEVEQIGRAQLNRKRAGGKA